MSRKNHPRHENPNQPSVESNRHNALTHLASQGEPSTEPTITASNNQSALTNPDRPSDTRASHRDTVVSSKGERKTVIDPISTWQYPPPWPEGPRLLAEVETATRRYVNLRPDELGEMPRILAGAQERIELQVNFPESTPGEKIYVEIPNGGSFPDTDQYGRIYDLPDNRTLSFPFVTDDALGYCTVTIRHGGHTRSLPVWVGDLPSP